MNWKDKNILITGGTGSFGRQCVKILLSDHHPKRIIIFSRDELKQYEMRVQGLDHSSLRYFIGDVRDTERLRRAMHGVNIVIHAAALKQVPSCEYNPHEAILTNIMGAHNVIEAALDCEVEKVIALSSDKAVNPINLYGGTKLVAEKLFIQANSYSGTGLTRFSCARYGNVVGSRGSVIPLFLQQKKSGTVTVTDKRMTRFWITLAEGVKFVLSCVDQMHGGEIFVPKIPSAKIMDLVSVFAPKSKVKYIGIRPGEKLHEVLISEDEARHTIELADRYIIKPIHPWWKTENWKNGEKLSDDFIYASNSNSNQLTIDQIRKMKSQLEDL